jgi:hypothetical protein
MNEDRHLRSPRIASVVGAAIMFLLTLAVARDPSRLVAIASLATPAAPLERDGGSDDRRDGTEDQNSVTRAAQAPVPPEGGAASP